MTMIRKLLLIIIALILLPVAMCAQKPTERERQTWMKEMQQYKNDYISRKLELTEEQKTKFLPLYNRMETEVRKLSDQTMKMERDVRKKGDAATELEYEKAAEAQFELKAKEAQIELKYFKEFKTVLKPQQLLKLKRAERDFSRELMKHHEKQNKQKKQSKQTRQKKDK